MKLKDFVITVKDKKIEDVIHKEFDVVCWIVDANEKYEIVNKANAFINGLAKSFRVWSDYDPEEASTDIYLAISTADGEVVQYVLDSMELLFDYLNNREYDVYRVRIEDGLL